MFLPYFLPAASIFHLFVSGNPPVTRLRTNQVIKLEPLTHLSVSLELQILNRSTHLELHPTYEKGEVYLNSPFSTSVTSKHCVESLFLFNCSRQILQIPTGSALYTIHGLLHFPDETGEILTIQNLSEMIPLCSSLPLFIPQSVQLFQDKETAFVLTCQNYLLSTYNLFHPEDKSSKQENVLDTTQEPPTLFPKFPITNAPCKATAHNTFFNYSDSEINPTCGEGPRRGC